MVRRRKLRSAATSGRRRAPQLTMAGAPHLCPGSMTAAAGGNGVRCEPNDARRRSSSRRRPTRQCRAAPRTTPVGPPPRPASNSCKSVRTLDSHDWRAEHSQSLTRISSSRYKDLSLRWLDLPYEAFPVKKTPYPEFRICMHRYFDRCHKSSLGPTRTARSSMDSEEVVAPMESNDTAAAGRGRGGPHALTKLHQRRLMHAEAASGATLEANSRDRGKLYCLPTPTMAAAGPS